MVNRMPHIYSIFSQTIYKSNKLYFPKARTMQSRVVKILVTYILRSVYVHGSRVHNLRIRYTTAVTGDDGWATRNEVMGMRRPLLTTCTLEKGAVHVSVYLRDVSLYTSIEITLRKNNH